MTALALVAVGLGGLMVGGVGGFAAARRRPRPAAEPLEAGPCAVPACTHAAQLRGLCRRHYGKAYRLGVLESLGEAELQRLAQDRRRQSRAGLRMVASR